jgi:hypothetical protein
MFVDPSSHYYCLPKHLPEKAPQRPQKAVSRDGVSKPVARLRRVEESFAYVRLSSSPKPLALAYGQLSASVSTDPVHQSRVPRRPN